MSETIAEKCHLNIYLLAKYYFSEMEEGEKVKHECPLLLPKLPFLDIYEFVFWTYMMCGPMSGKNWRLVAHEPVGFEV